MATVKGNTKRVSSTPPKAAAVNRGANANPVQGAAAKGNNKPPGNSKKSWENQQSTD